MASRAVTPEESLAGLRAARATVDLSRLAANYRAVAAACPVPLMPVVKADAYGHGAAFVARLLESLGASHLAVAYPEEGVLLRRAGVRVPVVLLAGFTPAQGPVLLEHGLTPVVSTPLMAEAARALARESGRALPVHLKVDTGIGRLGFPTDRVAEVAEGLRSAGRVEIEGLMTHLASADEDRAATERQLDRFDAALADLGGRGIRPRWVHAVNSAGLQLARPTHTLARPGLLLYGLPTRPLTPDVAVRPVMTLSADIALVKDVPVGAAISYGGRWTAARPSRIATVPLGYADGVPRTEGMRLRGTFAVGRGRAPLAGVVCMDLTMLDVTDCPEAAGGSPAVVFGDSPTAWDVADWSGTNAWEIFTSVGARVPRVYVEDGRVVGVESRLLP